MDAKFTRLDESEGKVEFSGQIMICYEQKTDFERDLQEVIIRYSI